MSDTEDYYSDFDNSVEQSISPLPSATKSYMKNSRSSKVRSSPTKTKTIVRKSPTTTPIRKSSKKEEDMYITGTPIETQLYDSDDFPSIDEGLPEDETAQEYEDDFNISPSSPKRNNPTTFNDDVSVSEHQEDSDHHDLREFSSVTFAPDEAPQPNPQKKLVYKMKKLKKRAKKPDDTNISKRNPVEHAPSQGKHSSSSKRSDSAQGHTPLKPFPPERSVHSDQRKVRPNHMSVVSSAFPAKQTSVYSSIAVSIQPKSFELQHQVLVLDKKCQAYRRQVQALQEKLDESRYIESIEVYKSEIKDLHQQLIAVQEENESYKQIIRHQEKFLISKDSYEQKLAHNEAITHEKLVEIMSLEVKKCREKVQQHRQSIADYEILHQDLQDRLQRLSKNNSVLRRFKQKVLAGRAAKQSDGTLPPLVEASTAEENGNKNIENELSERLEAMERNHAIHTQILQKEIAGLKLSLTESEQSKSRLEQELEKREGFIRLQVHYLKELKKKYVDLGQQMKDLVQANAVLFRDQKAPVKKFVPVPPPPVPAPAPPSPIPTPEPVLMAPNAAKVGLLADAEDDGPGGSTAVQEQVIDMTFLTNQDDIL